LIKKRHQLDCMSGPSCARKASQGQREQQNMYFQKCLANKNSDGGLA